MRATACMASVPSSTLPARRRLIRVVRPTKQQPKMKLIPKSTFARCLWMGTVLLLMALTGPALIHFAYRVTTPLAVKQSQTERYHRLANSEAFDASLSDAQRMRTREERLSLFYWFHARGWDIDEGVEDSSWLKPWRELIQHWTHQMRASSRMSQQPHRPVVTTTIVNAYGDRFRLSLRSAVVAQVCARQHHAAPGRSKHGLLIGTIETECRAVCGTSNAQEALRV